MNLFLMPMWLLSGSFFPVSGAPAWLQFVMMANPLTYGLRALRRVLESGSVGFFNSTMDLGFTFLFSVLIFILGLWVVRKRTVIS
jgi:ABC-2 type transport system permease protein